MHFGLKQTTIEVINSVFVNHPEIEEAVLYGSRAKGNHRAGSDIDLTLKGVGLNTTILSKINQEIDELNTPCLFDIIIFEMLNSATLTDHINRVGKLFYERPVSQKV